jgi:hypothetical protein
VSGSRDNKNASRTKQEAARSASVDNEDNSEVESKRKVVKTLEGARTVE